MKGILLAGGSGSRLFPSTLCISKQLLPVYDKPTLYYPLSVLMLAGIQEILIISTARDIPLIQSLLGSGAQFGLQLSYKIQEKPEGIAQAFLLAEDFIGDSPCCLILGDNIFFGHDVTKQVVSAAQIQDGATIFAYQVHDPERYGVVEINPQGQALNIEEKPKQPRSNLAITGLYFYDKHVVSYAKALKPSKRGELEITDLNRMYLEKNKLNVQIFGRGVAWLDTGTHESLLESSLFVQTIEKRQGLKIACLEEIALIKKFITPAQLQETCKNYPDSTYGQYVKKLAQTGLNTWF